MGEEELAVSHKCPCVVDGDFNEEEKLGGLAFTLNEALEFASYLNDCALTEVQTSVSKYTWWNGLIEEDCIIKRLDSILVNRNYRFVHYI